LISLTKLVVKFGSANGSFPALNLQCERLELTYLGTSRHCGNTVERERQTDYSISTPSINFGPSLRPNQFGHCTQAGLPAHVSHVAPETLQPALRQPASQKGAADLKQTRLSLCQR
jgi:hypothetical protein